MKYGKILSKIVCLLFLFPVVFFSTESVLPQSGKADESATRNLPADQSGDEQKTEIDFSKLENYEYIEPITIIAFIKTLNKFGAKGYRFRDLTQVRYSRDAGNISVLGTKFAGIVRLDETKYEYKVIEVEASPDITAALNRESKDGFNFREIISYESSISFTQEEDDIFLKNLQAFLSAPQLHNLILLERETGKEIVPRQFQLLKAGFGIGKNPSEKMQTLLNESVKQNFYPLGAYMSYGFATPGLDKSKWQIIDNYYGIVLEKSAENQTAQFQFVRSNLQGTLKKQINKLALDGFKIGDVGFLQGLMYKNREISASTTTYQWVNANSKTLADDLLKLSNSGAKFYGTSLRMSRLSGSITESAVVFEQPPSTDQTRYEYLPLKMVNDTPQLVLIAKTIIPPDEPVRKFRRLIRQGYTFTGLIYADDEIVALFERRRSDIK